MAQVRVVGAGPAGLMAAEVLAGAGHGVTLVDHHRSQARKFLLAGRGGLNLTHAEPLEKLLSRYGPYHAFLEPAIRAFPPDALRAWCAELGVETFVGSTGRVFPVGLRASPLLRAWLRRLQAMGVVLQSATAWTGFDAVPTVLALGGASWPELGSDAGWLPAFRDQDIALVPFRASNVRQPVAWGSHFSERFRGQPIKNVAVSCGGVSVRGEIMIAEDGLEGGAIYGLSRALREANATRLVIDLKPDLSADVVAQRLAAGAPKQSLSNRLRKSVNLSNQAIGLMRETGSTNPKMVVVKLSGEPSLKRAISSAGGVARQEVNADFSLRKIPHYSVCGEMLDWDAPTGGYLLQACFSTAHWAATHMAKRLGAG